MHITLQHRAMQTKLCRCHWSLKVGFGLWAYDDQSCKTFRTSVDRWCYVEKLLGPYMKMKIGAEKYLCIQGDTSVTRTEGLVVDVYFPKVFSRLLLIMRPEWMLCYICYAYQSAPSVWCFSSDTSPEGEALLRWYRTDWSLACGLKLHPRHLFCDYPSKALNTREVFGVINISKSSCELLKRIFKTALWYSL